MAYTTANYESVEETAPGMTFLRDALDCDELGVTVVEGHDGWIGKEHDHANEGHEEVYLLLSGSAAVTVGDDVLPMEPGDAVRVDPETTRQLAFDDESRLVIVGAP